MRIEVSETFNFKGDERLEEKHIWKKQLHSLGGGNLLDAEAETADLTNQLEGHELIAAASVARHSVHSRRKRSGKESTWHEVRLEGKVRDTGSFRLGSGVKADELVFGTSADVRTRKMVLPFTREEFCAAPNVLEPVAQLCGEIEVTDHGVLTGSGAIYAAVQRSSGSAVQRLPMSFFSSPSLHIHAARVLVPGLSVRRGTKVEQGSFRLRCCNISPSLLITLPKVPHDSKMPPQIGRTLRTATGAHRVAPGRPGQTI